MNISMQACLLVLSSTLRGQLKVSLGLNMAHGPDVWAPCLRPNVHLGWSKLDPCGHYLVSLRFLSIWANLSLSPPLIVKVTHVTLSGSWGCWVRVQLWFTLAWTWCGNSNMVMLTVCLTCFLYCLRLGQQASNSLWGSLDCSGSRLTLCV